MMSPVNMLLTFLLGLVMLTSCRPPVSFIPPLSFVSLRFLSIGYPTPK
ncbi:hypothetical protein AAZV13_14G121300 [Glycine max]